MPKIIRNLQASCNLLNPRQKRLYDFVIEQAGPNVSDWMKGLIEREMVRIEISNEYPNISNNQRDVQKQTISSDVARGFI